MKKYLIAIFSLLSYTAFAQIDSKDDTLVGSKLETITIQAPGDTHKKSGDGNSRTERLLENIPGISLISRGTFAQEAVIRGMSDGQLNITINGMHIFGACTDRMDPATSYIEPNNLKSIIVNTNPSFGTGGASIAGGMQFQLKEATIGEKKQWHGTIGSGWESNNNARQYLGNLQYSTSRFALLLDGIFRKADNYSPGGSKQQNIDKYGTWTQQQVFTVNGDGKINFSQYEKWNLHLNSAYQLSQNSLLKVNYLHDNGSNIGYPALTMDVKYARANMANINYIYSNNAKALSYWETSLYYNKVNHAMDDTKRPLEQISMHMDMPGWSETKGGFSQITWSNSPHQQLKVKVEAYSNRWHAEMTMYPKNGSSIMQMLTIPDAQKKMAGIDLENRWHIVGNWHITVGAHVEYNQFSLFTDIGKQQLSTISTANSERKIFPYNFYAKAQKKLSEKWTILLNVARAMRAPTIKELYAVYLYNPLDNFDYVGNPNLATERSWNMEAQLGYTTQNFHVDLRTYAYHFSNYIAGGITHVFEKMNDYASGVKQYQNISKAHIIGSELTFHWQIFPNIYWNSGNTYGYGKDGNSNALPYIQALRSNNTFSYGWGKTWNVHIDNLISGPQNHVSSFYGEKKTPGFSIFDAGVNKSFTFKAQKLHLGCNIRNIFNKYYFEHLDIVQLPRQGRNIQIQLSYDF